MKKKICKVVVFLFVLFSCLAPFSASAAVSLDRTGSISISVLDKETREPIGDAVFRIYKIATAHAVGEGVRFTYTNEFKENGMSLGDLSDTYLPTHLMVYATNNHIPFNEIASSSDNKVLFDNLSCGAYLVVPVSIKNGYLNPTPFIVPIPAKNQSSEEWLYDLDPTPKTQIDTNAGEKTQLTVEKRWEGSKKESVSVSLIKDNAVVDTVTLNADNQWKHKWENLDKNHSWRVVENDVPNGYEVFYNTSDWKVTITNKDSTPPSSTTTTKPDKLTQTGQLNWPVPILLIVGLLLILVGWSMLNLSKKGEENG